MVPDRIEDVEMCGEYLWHMKVQGFTLPHWAMGVPDSGQRRG
jgi:hypothetical protein